LPAEVQLLLSQPIPVGPQTDALLLEANDHLVCRFLLEKISPQPLAEESLLVFELSPTPLELLVPPAQGFGRVVQARFLGGRLDDRVLGLLDRLLERRSFGRPHALLGALPLTGTQAILVGAPPRSPLGGGVPGAAARVLELRLFGAQGRHAIGEDTDLLRPGALPRRHDPEIQRSQAVLDP